MTVWYHATAYYGDKMRHWWNRSRDELATDVVVPFVSKQIHLLKRNGIHSFFNFGMAEYITVVKTSYRLRMIDGKAPRQLSDSTFVAQNSATDEFLSEMKRSSGGSARSIVEQALTPPDNKAFVVMKFSDAVLNSAYKRVYRPVCLACGLEDVVRVDEIQNSGNVSLQILENMARSKVVIADLSGERPNCYYEAGYAHALGKPIIFCIRMGETVHFDLAPYRFIEWETEDMLEDRLRSRLEAMMSQRDS